MGLDMTHGCWNGPYSEFGEWRDAVAKAAGHADWINVVKINDDRDGRLFGRWPDGEPADPLNVLWAHSDCDGIIAARHCVPLAKALRALVHKLKGSIYEPGSMQWLTIRFAAGLLYAASRNENVEFH